MSDLEREEIKKLKKKLKKQALKNSEIKDEMAIQRTIFANERTLMAYLRTSIAILAGGFASIKFSQHAYMELMGVSLMLVGVMLTMYSFYRYFQKQKLIKQQRKDYTYTSQYRAELLEKDASRYGNME